MGALANLGHPVSDQTVGNILKRHGLGPAPERKRHTTWAEFIRRHKDVLWATDFFTTEVWTCTGLTTYYVLFFIHIQIGVRIGRQAGDVVLKGNSVQAGRQILDERQKPGE